VIHAGGIGTCAEALKAGLPSVVIPYAFDQPDNAERLRRLGVAEVLSRDAVDARNLTDKLDQLLKNPRRSQSAKQLAALIRPEEAMASTIARIESTARSAIKN
jgi:UDP:flavonoid glycosyltransferase YjiC (YdhE family)